MTVAAEAQRRPLAACCLSGILLCGLILAGVAPTKSPIGASRDAEDCTRLEPRRQRRGLWWPLRGGGGRSPKYGERGDTAANEGVRHAFWETQPVPQTPEDDHFEFQSNSGKQEAECDEGEGPLQKSGVLGVNYRPDQRQRRPGKRQGKVSRLIGALVAAARPPALPLGLEFCSLNLSDASDMGEVHSLLQAHYSEDDLGMFRLDYQPELIKWMSLVPGSKSNWFVGVRKSSENKQKSSFWSRLNCCSCFGGGGRKMAEASTNTEAESFGGELVGCVSATPLNVTLDGKNVTLAFINFLTLKKDLRAKRLAPILIREITRRVSSDGIFQAMFTGAKTIPTPLYTAQYQHRMLNVRKTQQVKFFQMAQSMTVDDYEKFYQVESPKKSAKGKEFVEIGGRAYRPMTERDVEQVAELWESSSRLRRLGARFDHESIRHHLLPKPGIVSTYVTEAAPDGTPALPPPLWSRIFQKFQVSNNNNNNHQNNNQQQQQQQQQHCSSKEEENKKKKAKISGFVSFYSLPLKVLNHSTVDNLQQAYVHYYATKGGPGDPEPFDLINAAISLAKAEGFDVLNSLTVMDSDERALRRLRFMGGANLNFYLYNWKMRNVPLVGEEIGIVPM